MPTSSPWWNQHKEEFRACFPTTTNPVLAERFGTTVEAIAKRARKEGLKKTAAHVYAVKSASSRARWGEARPPKQKGVCPPDWEREEEAMLRAHYATAGMAALQRLLPNRGVSSIYNKASGMNLTKASPWTTEQDDYLKEKYSATPNPTVLLELAKLGPAQSASKLGDRVSVLKLRKTAEFRRQMSSINGHKASENRAKKLAAKPPVVQPIAKAPKRAAEKAAPVGKAHKELEKPGGLAQQLRELGPKHVLRKVYLYATRPGAKPADVPKTIAQLRVLLPSVPPFFLR